MMTTFKEGDTVRIINIGVKLSYEPILNKIGTIVKCVEYDCNILKQKRTKYYVDVPHYKNEWQADGLYVFENSDWLMKIHQDELWRHWFCDDVAEPYVKIIKKEENKNMEILELYYNIKRGETLHKRTKELEKLKNSHPVIKAINEFINSMKDVKGLTFSYNYAFEKDAEFDAKIEKLKKNIQKTG